MVQRRTFTCQFKAQVVLEVLSGVTTVPEACRQHGLKPGLLCQWKTEFVHNTAKVFEKDKQRGQERARR